jgi:arylsulfatase A-like enzyme
MRIVRSDSNSSLTRESVSILMSGRLPTCGDGVGWGAAPNAPQETLGELFANAGYETGAPPFGPRSALIHDLTES